MVLCLASGAALLALSVLLALWLPVSLSSNVQGRAEPSGGWAVACGVGLGPIALSAIAARGVAPFVTCHVFGKQLARLPLSRWIRRTPAPTPTPTPAAGVEPEPAPAAALSRFERAVAGFFRSVDPLEALLSWWERPAVFRVCSLIVDVKYSFRDVALTGRTLAALYMLSGVLPENCVINQTPGWDSEDRVALVADGRFRIWPGRLLLYVVRFVLKQRSEARNRAATEATQQDERIQDR